MDSVVFQRSDELECSHINTLPEPRPAEYAQ